LVPYHERHWRRSVQQQGRRTTFFSDVCKLFTKSAQSSGPENIGPERPLSGNLAVGPVLSPARITLEHNEKIRPRPDRENAFTGASGGGDGTGGERSPPAKVLILLSTYWIETTGFQPVRFSESKDDPLSRVLKPAGGGMASEPGREDHAVFVRRAHAVLPSLARITPGISPFRTARIFSGSKGCRAR
jgi:hypothetical protein